MADEFAIVEIMGHRIRAGRVSETQVAGAPMLRIEHPASTEDDPLFELYASTALFCVRPCNEEVARAWADRHWARPRAELTAATEDDSDDEDDETDYWADGE